MTALSLLRKISFHEVVILLAFISACGLQFKNFADDPGVGWHLETGRYVLTEGVIPQQDPFLGGGMVRAWVSDQWLSDCVLFSLFDWGSWPLVYAVLAVFYLITYLGVLYGGLRSLGASALAATFAAMVAFKAGQIHFILRPVMVSFLCFSVAYLHCLREEQSIETRVRAARVGLLGLLFLLWANMHPGFVLGLLLLAVLCGVQALKALARKQSWEGVRRAFMYLIAAGLATCINPYGLSLHQSIFALQQSDYFMNLHEEWLPVRLDTPEGELCVFISVLLIAAAVFGRGPRRVGTPFSILLVLIFAYACFDAVRMVPFFGIVASYPLTCALRALGRNPICSTSKPFARLCSAFSLIEAREQAARKGYGLLGTIGAVLILSSLITGGLILFSGPFGPRAEKFPYAGVARLLEQQQRYGGKPWTVASGAEWGGFITQFGKGDLKPLIDDRNTLVGEEFYREYEDRIESAIKWDAYLDAKQVDAVLIPPTRLIAHAIRNNPLAAWQIIYSDELQLVAVRK